MPTRRISPKNSKLTQEKLKELLIYEPETGLFFRKKWNKHIGCRDNTGYIKIQLLCTVYKAHRLAFLYMQGFMPEFVDHINRNTYDNRWCNLRAVTHSENIRNAKIAKNNKSGYKNVSLLRGKWRARGIFYNRHFHLGLFNCPTAAFIAVRTWELNKLRKVN